MVARHNRSRSEMSFAELSIYDKLDLECGEDYVEEAEPTKASRRQLAIIYILFLAEAIMASSLQPQLKMLVTNDDFCGNLSTSYMRSILDCAYALGCTAGLFWGWASDRVGRRPVALIGVFGMSLCCLGMGFATDVVSCAIFRCLAGLVSASTAVTTLTMIGDVSQTASDRTINISRLPLIALCGSVGPVFQGMVSGSLRANGALWEKYPILSSQIACGSLVFVIAVTAYLMLEETLPRRTSLNDQLTLDSADGEKAAFLGQVQDDEDMAPAVAIIGSTLPEPISIRQILRAPSLVILLISFSLLSLQSSTFDALLPHLGHSPTHHGGMGIPCSLLGFVVLFVRAMAGLLVLATVPRLVERLGLLRPYRLFSLCFPAIYLITPLFAFVAASSASAAAASSSIALLFKHTLFSSAQVVAILLVLNASPDAFSTGTIVGLMQSASVFKALAVAVSGMSFYFSSEVSVAMTNYALWSVLVGFSVVGAALAWFVRDHPRVNQDFPAEVLKWEMCFDAPSEGREMPLDTRLGDGLSLNRMPRG